ncbi:penicillin-binding protein [Streptomyces sp. RKND-216]|uniref:transglycosylase domain-containing protein n=1 Tax=Streptomyces sp. RKND-216 TaxID=2562581 RepID=UPI00109DA231|nr:transglycosylase domain-containing protein [Streptomyces sp. RKND-216]THA25260.1 penicillin-binding protein [Streptomyces sp. RKND-216]
MASKRAGGLSMPQQVARFIGVSVLAGAVTAGIALPGFGLMGLAAKGSVEGFDELPAKLKRPPLSQRTTILDNEGGEIAKVYSRDRTVVDIAQMSPYVKQAIVAIEDSRFYEHGAVDLKGVLRALNENAQSGQISQGASTLTQQYVKNVFVEAAKDDPDAVAEAQQQTIGRKIRELKYAIQIEEELTKKQILENYLNITYFGQGAYGVEAAAQRFFSKPAKDLELHESALLAGLVQSPSYYDPTINPDRAKQRRNAVLSRMAGSRDVTREEAKAAAAQDLGLDVSQPQQGCITAVNGAGFFCDYVKEVFLASPAFGKTAQDRRERWNRGGLTIKTTLDPQAQTSAQESVTSRVDQSDSVASAMTVVEPGTGRILSMAQSRPYGTRPAENETTLNLSVDHDMGGPQNGYQVGSTFKAFTAAAALEKGISPAQTFTTGSKLKIDKSKFTDCNGAPGAGPWSLQNELDSEKGTWDMSSALAKSINTYFVLLEEKAGVCAAKKTAERAGFHRADGSPTQEVPSLTLGTQGASPLTMATAYATFANRGVHCTPIALEAVTDDKGRKLGVPESTCSRAMPEKIADTLNEMLTGVVTSGTAPSAKLADRDNAGKTGTTDGMKSAWFVGYTPEASGAVWVGDVNHQVEMYDITVGGQYYPKVCGGCLPAPIWKGGIAGALEGAPATPFQDVDVPRAEQKKPEDDRDEDRDDDRPGDGGGSPFPDFTIPPDLIGGNDNGGGWGRGRG